MKFKMLRIWDSLLEGRYPGEQHSGQLTYFHFALPSYERSQRLRTSGQLPQTPVEFKEFYSEAISDLEEGLRTYRAYEIMFDNDAPEKAKLNAREYLIKGNFPVCFGKRGLSDVSKQTIDRVRVFLHHAGEFGVDVSRISFT